MTQDKPMIRPITPTDLPRLAQMIEALSSHHGDDTKMDMAALERDVLGENPLLIVLIAEVDGRAVGYAALYRLAWLQWNACGLDLHHLYVDPAMRGKRVGVALMTAARELALQMGCTRVLVGTDPANTNAQEFYLSQGMTVVPPYGPRFRWVLDGE